MGRSCMAGIRCMLTYPERLSSSGRSSPLSYYRELRKGSPTQLFPGDVYDKAFGERPTILFFHGTVNSSFLQLLIGEGLDCCRSAPRECLFVDRFSTRLVSLAASVLCFLAELLQ